MQKIIVLRDIDDSYVNNLVTATMATTNQKQFLVHCGWNTSDRTLAAQKRNCDETILVSEYCQLQNIQMVFISSQSASSQSNYGEMKKQAEAGVLINEGIVLRPGLIIFERSSGIQKILTNKIFFVLPIRFSPDILVKTITSLNLTNFITELIDGKKLQNRIVDLFDQTMTINSVTGKAFSHRMKISVPVKMVKPLLKILGRFNRRFYALYDSFLGLTT